MDPIADLLVRIKNAQAAGHETLAVPFSKVKLNLLKILENNGLIESLERKGVKSKERIEVGLKYHQGAPAIAGLKRISCPGQRIYLGAKKIRPVKQGYGLTIVSTSQGLMTGLEAKKKKLGGEILCQVW